ncbi:hypothetical protein JCM11641_004203 [Rhodosporidiobolus odoratus]
MAGGDSTDYDELPTAPVHRGRPFKQYGKRTRPPHRPVAPAAPQTREIGGGRSVARSVRDASSESSRGEQVQVSAVKQTGATGSEVRGRKKLLIDEADEGAKNDDEEQEVQGEKRKKGSSQTLQAGKPGPTSKPIHAQPSQPTVPPSPMPPAVPPAVLSAAHSVSPQPEVGLSTLATAANRRTRSERSPANASTANNTDLDHRNRTSKKARASPRLHYLEENDRAVPTPPRPQGSEKPLPVSTRLVAQVQEGQMTPRSRARALGDKSNRASLCGAVSRGTALPSQPHPTFPFLDSPRSGHGSAATSRRSSVARSSDGLDVFRDAPVVIQPISAPLTDLPARRRPLLRASSQPSSLPPAPSAPPFHPPHSASGALPLPRSPGSTLAQPFPPRVATASPRIPRAALSRRGSTRAHLGVPGTPTPGQASRVPPPWALTAPPTSSPASLSGNFGLAEVEAGGIGGPVFRFTTTQFEDLPSLSLGAGEVAEVGLEAIPRGKTEEDESLLVGMESSFMLQDEEDEGDMMVEDATARWVDESRSLSREVGLSGENAESQQGLQAFLEDEVVQRLPCPEPDNGVEEDPNLISDSGFLDILPATTSCLLPSADGASAPRLPASRPLPQPDTPQLLKTTLLSPPSASLFSASFMPPRRPRPLVSSALPSGPPSSEDELAYYLRVTGTFSSEDDLSPPSSPLNSSGEEDRLAELEIGRAVKPSSGQRSKRVEAHEEVERTRAARKAVRGLQIGEGKGGRRKGWKREILSPVEGWKPVLRPGVKIEPEKKEEGYEADQGEVESEDELALCG